MSSYEPVYTEGGDTLYIMDQLSDKKNKEENWVQNLALQDAVARLNERERQIIRMRFYEGRPRWRLPGNRHLAGAGQPAGKVRPALYAELSLRRAVTPAVH